MENKYKYSVLSYMFGAYDSIREPKNPDPDVEYVFVTDNVKAKSDVWNIVILDKELQNNDNYNKVYYVKYHPFEFVHTNVCVRLDASVQILESLDGIIKYFNDNEFDMELMVHPARATFDLEYAAWCYGRGLDERKMYNFLSMMSFAGYDVQNYKGLFETTIFIERKTQSVVELNANVYNFIMFMNLDGNTDWNDQCYFSYIVNKFYQDKLKILPLSEQVIHSKYLRWMQHSSEEEQVSIVYYEALDYDLNYVFNEPTLCMYFL